ncbi:hypothetical protein ACGFI3_26375 [Nonomuraea wenchangensis]|uniref:hypothetical protein n=1 Tax=Nonomuraea wenchangensis TaxID=568860 RepID=UPI00371D303D
MTATQQQGRDEVTSNGGEPRRIDMPMLGIEVRRRQVEMPHVSMPSVPMPHISKQEFGHYVDVARTILPPPERVAYYGALGAMAVFGVIEWPVAAAIGVGMAVMQRRRQGASKTERKSETTARAQPQEPPERPEPKTRGAAAAQRAAAEAASKRKSK